MVDPDSLAPVPDGQQGLLLARGPGVMAGYYKDEAATAKVGAACRGWGLAALSGGACEAAGCGLQA